MRENRAGTRGLVETPGAEMGLGNGGNRRLHFRRSGYVGAIDRAGGSPDDWHAGDRPGRRLLKRASGTDRKRTSPACDRRFAPVAEGPSGRCFHVA